VRLSADDTDEYEPLIAASSALGIDRSVEPTDGALVIYSSGTTGRPKGVVLSHTALVAHTVSVGTRFPFEDGDSNLVAMPMFHVGGVCWSFLSIHAGRPGIVVRNPDAPSLLAGLAAGATHAFFVPPVISGLLAGGPTVAEALAGLKFLGYGAAPMPEPLLRTALEAWSHVNFVQVYGQTEISGVAVTLEPADHRDPQRGRLLASAGKPVPGVELRIADPITEQDVPAGQQGEIWVRSAQVMTEYLNRPDATAETVTAEGWLRTGDIGRLDAEGYVYVEDRIKDMIITGGENVYGPEVERVLAEHPHIVDAAVIGVPDPKWGEAVKAVVVVSEPTSAEDVIAFCRERLAGYKCPLSVEFTDTLPRNASGKLLKRDLRAQYWPSADRKI
jgi:acyl-CoA synthetase (AMP-forming)/AMP-acid ligase II